VVYLQRKISNKHAKILKNVNNIQKSINDNDMLLFPASDERNMKKYA